MSVAISPSIPEGVAQCECEAKGAELMRLGEEEDDDDLFAAPEDAVIDENVQAEEPRADEPTEAHDAKIKTSPYLPSAAEVAKHCATHLPYRNWCPVCVKAKGKEDAHYRQPTGKDGETGLPVVAMDYDFLEEKLTVLVVKDESSGSTLAYDCETKGPTDA